MATITTNDEHTHQWGSWEQSRFAGTLHRKCQVPGCKAISLDADDDDGPTEPQEDDWVTEDFVTFRMDKGGDA